MTQSRENNLAENFPTDQLLGVSTHSYPSSRLPQNPFVQNVSPALINHPLYDDRPLPSYTPQTSTILPSPPAAKRKYSQSSDDLSQLSQVVRRKKRTRDALLLETVPGGSMRPTQVTRKNLSKKPIDRNLKFASEQVPGLKLPPVAIHYKEACDAMQGVCSDKVRYRKLLALRGITAQSILDFMQMMLDSDSVYISAQSRGVVLKAILRLSKRSMLYPRSFVLTHVDRGKHPVASGHFGEVYEGYYNNRRVSLKAFKLYLSQISEKDNLLRAFYKEAILWRHFNHRNLLPFYGIYQLGDSGGRICLVSPWMDNGNITEYLKKNVFIVTNRNYLTSDVAKGIAYLHEQSVIHGDLKGANILISNSGVACLADFGLSSIACKHSLTWTSVETTVSTAGTVRWQAPELLEENSLGATKESDMYAFACVLYEIYVGKVPFYESKMESAVIVQILRGKRPTRPELNSDSCISWGLTDWIWSLIDECWQEDPAVRLTASEVVEKLSSVAGFLRHDAAERDSWGELRSKAFKSLVDRQSKMTEEEMQRAISYLKSL